MRKVFTLFALLCAICCRAQVVEVSAVGGAAQYRMSAGIKNGFCGAYNVGVAFVKLKMIDFGVQFTGTTKMTMSSLMSPGVFADIVMTNKDDTKNIFVAGVQGNLTTFGSVKTPGDFYKNGGTDSVSTKIDNSYSFGVRLGYKRQIAGPLYGFILASAVYSFPSVIHYAGLADVNAAVFYVPVMIGVAARF